MTQYVVELQGESREIYIVEADSPAEARSTWMNGWLQIQESSGMEVITVREDGE